MSDASDSSYLVIVPRVSRAEPFMWADKVAFFLAAGWLALILFVWFSAVMICGNVAGTNLVRTTIFQALETGAAFVASAWIAMRLVDIAAGSVARRRSGRY